MAGSGPQRSVVAWAALGRPQQASGKVVETLLGRCTYFGLLQRAALCVWLLVELQVHPARYTERVPLWSSMGRVAGVLGSHASSLHRLAMKLVADGPSL